MNKNDNYKKLVTEKNKAYRDLTKFKFSGIDNRERGLEIFNIF